ncbi:MAG TPA: hypothetical protein VN922_08335 [Bacteroidia bacterium]|nr:hypothetical protein [Bacteroidia bacterium]
MKKIICASLVLLCACNHATQQKGLVYYNDFESTKGWIDLNLSKKVSHSGMYSNKFDSTHTFGITFKQLFKQISDDKIVKVKISYWVFLTEKAQGKLVMEIKKPDNSSAMWTARDLKTLAHKEGEWRKVETDFTFNDSINKPENTLAIYPWNVGKGDFYIDDLKLEFILGY